MQVNFVGRLSELITTQVSRRRFLAGLPAITAAAAVTSCARPEDEERAAGTTQRSDTLLQGSGNSSSRLDTAVLKGPQNLSSTTPGVNGAGAVALQRYDPALPPLMEGGVHRVHWHARELPVRVSPNLVLAAWTFEGDIPGPILHVRAGDTVEFTLTNDGHMAHSLDFHAAQVNPKTAFRSVSRGQSVSYTFKPHFAGAFMYHCGTAPVLMHIGSGMYGAIIVSPRKPLPAAREFVLVQSEYYLGAVTGGVAALDYRKMASTLPDYVVFNGRPDQYIQQPLRVKVGERVRFYVVSAGPTHPCNFHVVGEQFDTVYLGAPPDNAIRGVQTFSVPPGGGMIFDMIADVAGEFPFVNHGFGHGQKGSIGFLVVE